MSIYCLKGPQNIHHLPTLGLLCSSQVSRICWNCKQNSTLRASQRVPQNGIGWRSATWDNKQTVNRYCLLLNYCLFIVYVLLIVCLLSIYWLLIVYLLSIYRLFIVYLLFICYLVIVYLLSIYCLFICDLFVIHCSFFLCSVYILSMCCLFIVYLLSIYCPFIV